MIYKFIFNIQSSLIFAVIMNKNLLLLAIGSILITAMSFYKLIEHRKKSRKQKQSKHKKQYNASSSYSIHSSERSNVAESSQYEDHQERILYENDICEANPYKIVLHKPIYNTYIDYIHYNVLLSLNKSKGYEGVVKIKIQSKKNAINCKDLYIDFMGSCILFMAVNGRKIEEKEIVFQQHRILVKKVWLMKNQNLIEIIFANSYAFMGDGLACYFPLDQFNKYSLKRQVIYVRNGFKKVPRIFPCFNVLNPCEVDLEVLHPNGFNTESNNHKIQMKIATKKDYPFYQFLFYTNKSLNSSYRLNNSLISQSSYRSSNEQIVKAMSRFSLTRLNSIHDFFVFCSAIVEVRPQVNLASSSASSKTFKDVLIRYFTKEHLMRKASSFLGSLQIQIIQIFGKIDQYKINNKIPLKYQCKIDIFFIDDLRAEGDFYPGSIILNQKTIQRGIIDRRLYYLLCRAFVGMGMLMKKQDSLLNLQGIMKLNEITLQIFKQCTDYIYVKNKQYENIRNQCIRLISNREKNETSNKILLNQKEEKDNDMQFWILEYYEKQCRYFVRDFEKFENKISTNVKNIINCLNKATPEEYWSFFIARYPLIQFNVSEVLLKISLKYKGIPNGEAELKYAKDNFIKSKYYLKFFTHKEIQNDLKRFIQLQSHGLQKILPFIKIKESFLPYIPKTFEGYLYAKQNRLESKNLYEQFKKYNEGSNYHHISALRREIKRIKLLARDNIVQQRKNIQCGLLGWKLLQKLNLYPQDEDTYKLITSLQKINGNDRNIIHPQEQFQQIQRLITESAQEQAKKLQQLLEESTDKENSLNH